MPNKSAIADFEVDWSRLMANVVRNAAELPPHITLYSAPMEETLAALREIGASKQDRKAVKQQETKESQDLLKKGRNLAEKLRSAIIAHHGRESEELVAYGINPRRPRPRTPKKGTQPETPEPTPETKPAPQSGGQVTTAKAAEPPKPGDPAPASQSNPSPQAS
jgi:hypothetical protein